MPVAWIHRCLVVLLCLVISAPGLAGTDAHAGAQPAWVMLDGQHVLEIRAPFKNLSPEARAGNIARRIHQLAPHWRGEPLRIEETEISADLYLGDSLILSVFGADAGLAGVTPAELAAQHATRIRAALTTYRAEHGHEALLTAMGKTVLTGLGGILLLVIWERLYRRTRDKVLSHAEEKLMAVDRKTFGLLRMEYLRIPLLGLLSGLRLTFWALILYFAISLCLSYFPQTRDLAVHLTQAILAPLGELGSAFVHALPHLLVLFVVAWVVRYLLGSSSYFFARVGDGRIQLQGFYPDWATPTRRIVNFLIIVAGVMVAYPYIPGSSSDAFKGISIFLGVLLSIGSSGVIANLMTGLTMTYMRAFTVGDVIRIGDTLGTVVETSLLVTRLKTPKGVEITLPNALVMGGQVINYSRSGSPYLNTSVTIGYDAPWRQVHAMLLAAAARTRDVMQTPAPFVLQSALEDFYVRYELNVVLADPARQGRTFSELHQHIQDEFNAHGVQIMSPNYEAQPDQPVLSPRSQWFAEPASPD